MDWQNLKEQLEEITDKVHRTNPLRVTGRLVRLTGIVMEAEGCLLDIGHRCQIQSENGARIEAEVVGFDRGRLFLVPLDYSESISPGAIVIPLGQSALIPVGKELLGRVIDGTGKPLDDRSMPTCRDTIQLHGVTINPLLRQPVNQPLDIGVRSVNGLLTVGKGQRLGLFSPSGTGKSILLSMITKNTVADVVIVALIGERGREVRDFIERAIGDKGRQRSLVVAAPADHSPLMRMRAAQMAHRIAEYFRDMGADVLLLMDSLTRYVQARREIALAIGEPAAPNGYPPSCFNMMSRLVERAGNGAHPSGSLSAFYTVLIESEETTDPVSEAARAILDGHLVLSRDLAASGCFPAINILSSVSRTMQQTVSAEHMSLAVALRQLYEKLLEGRELNLLGIYNEGRSELMDTAMKAEPLINAYLQQGIDESVSWQESITALEKLIKACYTNATF